VRRLLALGAAVALTAPARAEEPKTLYGPVPPGLAALVGSALDERLASEAIARLENAAERHDAQAVLALSGDAGVRIAAERLAERPVGAPALEALLLTLSASPRADVDEVLARAARAPRFETRVVAAYGLGAGRSPSAIRALVPLASDPMPAVRAAAVRALFAIDTTAARTARLGLPDDLDPRIQELRLRLHRLRGDGDPALLPLALRSYVRGKSPGIRVEGARCLALGGVGTPPLVLALVLLEHGVSAETGVLVRAGLRGPVGGAPPGDARLVAAETISALLDRGDLSPDVRAGLVDMGVHHLAHPASVDGTRVDEDARRILVSILPEAGPGLVRPVAKRLESRSFADPIHGIRLLTSLDEATWLPVVRALADPRTAGDPRADPVTRAATGALRDLGRVGDPEVARALLDPRLPQDVVTDGVRALARDDAAIALPLLEAALSDRRDAVASTAAEVLLSRPEREARASVERAVLDATWRSFDDDCFQELVRPADDEAYALLERAFASGDDRLREQAFDAFVSERASLRGERARALVLRESKGPLPRGDTGIVARALARVDGAALVAFVRAHLPGARSPGVLLRNLQSVADPGALDLALEVAASTHEPSMLLEVGTVLAGPSARDRARTDPFWRRLLSSGQPTLVDDGLRLLRRADHGDLSDLLEPIVRSLKESDERRLAALKVLVQDWRPPHEPLLWGVASDPTEHEDLRIVAATALEGRASPAVREKAIVWLRERVDEPGPPVASIGRLSGKGASPADAAALVSILDATLARRFEARPYFRPTGEGDATDRVAYENRVIALTQAIGLSGDPAAFDHLADLLFDPRFAAYAQEVRRDAALGLPVGGGVLVPLGPSPRSTVLLHRGNTLPAPIPPEVRHVVAALKSGTPESAASRVARALSQARSSGRLAAFDDLYLLWLSYDLHHKNHGDFVAAADVVEAALDAALPSGGPEESSAADLRIEGRVREGRYDDAVALQERKVRADARSGLPDADERWIVERATLDFLRGAAAALAGRTEEARDAFRRGVARAPNDPTVRNNAAWYRACAGFDLEAAAVDARRALAVEHRLDDEGSLHAIDTYAYVLVRQGRFEEARTTIQPALLRIRPSTPAAAEYYWRYAQACVGTGWLAEAERSLVEALQKFEPTLDRFLRADPYLAPLHPRMDAIVARARAPQAVE
jgi:tetratricopeptide (TPR) repeat protein